MQRGRIPVAGFLLVLSVMSAALAFEFGDNGLHRLAETGDASAEYALGLSYSEGLGVPQDYAEATKWYRKAAEHGHVGAQFSLAVMYYDGSGVPQDYVEAAKWYRKAAENGHVRGQFSLAGMYHEGRGVPQDYTEAMKWSRMAAEQGHASAQFNLGVMYDSGQGVTQNYKEAMKWYRMAAEQGHASAQFNLGVMYDSGQGVTQNYKEAIKWYREAADQGDASAQYNLGSMYVRGAGVPQDYVQAHMWRNLAAANAPSDKRAAWEKTRDAIAADMTPAQIAEAQRRAQEWRPSTSASSSSEPPPPPPPPPPATEPAPAPAPSLMASGTCFAITPDGYLLTAHHVATAGKNVWVRLPDGRSVAAKVAKSLRSVDLAVLKVDVPTPNYLELADSGSANTGDKVFTLGFPASTILGTEPKFTDGSVSALSGPGDDATFLQVSVPIQPGNSGGPLVNEKGKVVGIVAATAAVEAFFGATGSLPQNVNWAVNADFARTLFKQPKTASASAPSRQAVIEKTKKALGYVMAFE
ncbi:MAG: SEL1-like repeat protein [Deltaproteobacteria bacterium]|nr:SEL1-like repeat protein [Deltaproteobacteria bacterium]